MLKDWDAFETLPEIDQMLLMEALMSTAVMVSRLGEPWVAERLMADPRCQQWAHGEKINLTMNGKPRLGFDALVNAVAETVARENRCGN